MGKLYVKFRCVHCLKCCTEVVVVPTPYDVNRIIKATRMHPRRFLEFLTPDEISGVDEDDPTWLICGDTRYLMALKRDPVKGCLFLDRKRRVCSVYEHRPFLCRLYPFKLHETSSGEFSSFSIHKDISCPRDKGAKVPTAPLYDWYLEDSEHQEAYEDLVKLFNREKHTDPFDFIDMFFEEVPDQPGGE